MNTAKDNAKPERLYFKTYLQLLHNSVGTAMFRNFFIRSLGENERDALDDGSNSCAFYVSAVLTIFQKLSAIHGTVQATVADLYHSGWQEVDNFQPGDVIVWEAMEFKDGRYEHIGFYIGNDRAVSTSDEQKVVVEHEVHFGALKRPIKQILRCVSWDQEPSA